VEYLPSKYKALSSNPSTAQKKERKENPRNGPSDLGPAVTSFVAPRLLARSGFSCSLAAAISCPTRVSLGSRRAAPRVSVLRPEVQVLLPHRLLSFLSSEAPARSRGARQQVEAEG
jgi:hypothetical protein